MKRFASAFLALILAASASAEITFKSSGSMGPTGATGPTGPTGPTGATGTTAYLGYSVSTSTTTITALRSRTLFSNPLEIVAAQSGYAYHVLRCVFSHPSGTNHTTTSVTGLSITRDTGTQLCGVTTANIYGDNNAQTTVVPASLAAGGSIYTALTLGTVANVALQVRTIGADLSGSGTFDTTVIVDYVTIPVPIP